MARVNVYLPDDLAEEARAAGLNVSQLSQEALRRELARRRTDVWLDHIETLPSIPVPHEEVIAAIDAAREELGFE